MIIIFQFELLLKIKCCTLSLTKIPELNL